VYLLVREQGQLPGETRRGRVRDHAGSLPEQDNGETGKTKNEKGFSHIINILYSNQLMAYFIFDSLS